MFLNRLTRFLILTNIIPVKIHSRTSFEFRICSWRTLLNLFFCFGTSFILFGFVRPDDFKEQMEVLSFILFALINFLIYPSLPTLMGYSLSQMDCTLFESQITASKTLLMSFLSFLCFALACVLQAFEWHYFETPNILQFVFDLVCLTYPCLYLIITSLCLASWIAAMSHAICRESTFLKTNVCRIKQCCNLYENFNKSFGSLLLVLFSTSSFLTIVNIFFVISTLVSGVISEQIPMCVGLTLSAFGHLIFMLSVVLGLDKVHNKMLALADGLDTMEETLKEEADIAKVKILKRKILNLKPISGLGFFNIDKNSFVGMLSFAATYIVILVQFRTS